MGFFSKLKKVLPYIQKGAVIAGQAEGNPIGAALATVELITAKQIPAGAPSAPLDTVKALAVATDDHEERLKRIEELLLAMNGKR